jgi:hypothetical protein
MKAVFIAYNQAHEDDVLTAMRELDIKGFTGWPSLVGAGQRGGEPHLGSHAWPTLNGALLTVIDDSKVDTLLNRLRDIDAASPQLGLHLGGGAGNLNDSENSTLKSEPKKNGIPDVQRPECRSAFTSPENGYWSRHCFYICAG